MILFMINIKVYKANLFASDLAQNKTAAIASYSKVTQWLMKAQEPRNKILQKFAKTRLLRKTESIYSQIALQNIDTGKKISKIIMSHSSFKIVKPLVCCLKKS